MEKGSDSDHSLGIPARTVSFAKPPSKQKEVQNDPANLTDLLRREARVQASSSLPLPVQVPQPVLTASLSIAKSNGMSDMTEASEVSSSRADERRSGGIWSKLGINRRRGGEREDHV